MSTLPSELSLRFVDFFTFLVFLSVVVYWTTSTSAMVAEKNYVSARVYELGRQRSSSRVRLRVRRDGRLRLLGGRGRGGRIGGGWRERVQSGIKRCRRPHAQLLWWASMDIRHGFCSTLIIPSEYFQLSLHTLAKKYFSYEVCLCQVLMAIEIELFAWLEIWLLYRLCLRENSPNISESIFSNQDIRLLNLSLRLCSCTKNTYQTKRTSKYSHMRVIPPQWKMLLRSDLSMFLYCTVSHKSHDPCFYEFLVGAGVITFVANCTIRFYTNFTN